MSKQRFPLLIMILMIFLLPHDSFTQEWSNEISIELPGQGMTTTPNFDIDPRTGHLHIVTMKNPEGVLYTEMDKDGNILKQTSIVNAAKDVASGGAWNGAAVAVDSKGYPHVVYREPIYTDPPSFTSYYTHWNGSDWTRPIELSRRVKRGWMLRIDIDENDKVHILRGSMADDPNDPEGNLLVGPVKYFRFSNDVLETTTDDIFRYSADGRVTLSAAFENQVHFLTSCSDYPEWGGPVWYWRSFNGGDTWEKTTVQNSNAKRANGSPDVFVDAAGHVHIVYGSQQDWQVNKWPSVRYTRFENNTQLFDIPVTLEGEVAKRFDTPQGVASVAASSDGEIVIVCFSEDFGGRLFTKESYDGGRNWSQKELIAEESCGSLGRNGQVIRAIGDIFYALYPTPSGVKLRIKAFSTNASPVADIGGPYSGYEGDLIQFDASGSTDEDGNIETYEWDFNDDGVYELMMTIPFASNLFPDDYNGNVRLRVTDGENASNTDHAMVIIRNVAPTAYAGGPYRGMLGEVIRLTGTATDPGADQLTYSWDLDNNGSFETPGANVQKIFNTNGRHNVVLKVSDDDGGIGYDTTMVQINNDPPMLSHIGNQTIDEGDSFDSVNLYQAVYDADNDDSEIGWIFSGQKKLNISVEFDSIAHIAVVDSEWNGSETILFIAMDPGQSADSATAVYTVLPVNDPPKIGRINVPPINEGEVFDYIFLDTYLSDPDNAISEIMWDFRGNSDLSVMIDQRVAIVTPPDEDWYGAEDVTFVATDENGNGLSAEAVVRFIVQPINDPPQITGIPDQTVKYTENFHPVLLDTCVNDVDTPPANIQWSYFGNHHFTFNINYRILSVQSSEPDWIGTETVYFIASDGEFSDTTAATFTTVYFNTPPVTQGFFNQTINENGHFETLYLDNMVNDPDHRADELSWSYYGNHNMLVSGLSQRMLQIAVADSEWAGSETITFVVTDPGGLSDSSFATYSVIPMNDPPKLRNFPLVSFIEDSSFTMTRTELKNYLFDPDGPFEQIQLSFDNSGKIKGSYNHNTAKMTIYTEADWFGEGRLGVITQDNLYASSTTNIDVKVVGTPDPPYEFSLLTPIYGTFYSQTPATLQFTWEEAVDPDANSDVTYTLNLSRDTNFSHIIDQFNFLSDTTLIYKLPDIFYPGIYYWQVIATDNDGYVTKCRETSAFNMENGIDVADDTDESVPSEFALFPNYPNPFNPETRITYHIPRATNVTMHIYNNLGQLIRTLVDRDHHAGIYTVLWDGKDLNGSEVSSGIYIYRLISEERVLTRKMLLLQ
ncbi:PKD domain-containing protein [candidate division KSB1 bacterium]|nr:PKD domain-containing protein [candidate division KSB1 bacterium]